MLHVSRHFCFPKHFHCKAIACQKIDALCKDEEEFRVFEIPGLRRQSKRPRKQRRTMPEMCMSNEDDLNILKRFCLQKIQRKYCGGSPAKRKVPPPRYKQMRTDQDWTDVWPSAATFKWSVVPFPARQGYPGKTIDNSGVIPSKYANAELMKIPNFLHLTAAHVKKHCAALKGLCTQWPAGLPDDDAIRHHFPVQVESSDYLFSGPSIRDERARVVSFKDAVFLPSPATFKPHFVKIVAEFKTSWLPHALRLRLGVHLSDLHLDKHARDKFIRLAGGCYKPKTGEVIFISDKCPTKKQNHDYAVYLLTALYRESLKYQSWEDGKTVDDWEEYFWDISKSKETMIKLVQANKEIDKNSSAPDDRKLLNLPDCTDEETLLCSEPVQDYRAATVQLVNDQESTETIQVYKDAVCRLLNLRCDVV